MKSIWRFTGTSGKEYTFTSQTRSDRLSVDAGLFILAYIHPRGHLAGYQLHILHLGVSENLKESIGRLNDDKHLSEGCWNATLILKLGTGVKKADTFQDLQDLPNEHIFATPP